MRPKKITLKGITTFQNATIIDFTKFGNFFAIIGENGSGKSSIFDAMTHALFGAAAKSSKGVNLSSLYSSNDASIEFEFQHRNETYRVRRSIKERQGFLSKLNKKNNWEILVERSEKEITKKIEDILGLDIDLFTKTTLIPQDRFRAIIDQKAAERRNSFKHLANTTIYEEMREQANIKKKEIEQSIATKIGELGFRTLDIYNENNKENIDTIELKNKKIELYAKQEHLTIKLEDEKNVLKIYQTLEKEIISYSNIHNQKNNNDKEIVEDHQNMQISERDFKNNTSEINNIKKLIEEMKYLPKAADVLEKWNENNDLESSKKIIEKKIMSIEQVKSINEIDTRTPILNNRLIEIASEIEKFKVQIRNEFNKLKESISAINPFIQSRITYRKEINILVQIEKKYDAQTFEAIIANLQKGDICPVCNNVIAEIEKKTINLEKNIIPKESIEIQRDKVSNAEREMLKLAGIIEKYFTIDIKNDNDNLLLSNGKKAEVKKATIIELGNKIYDFENKYDMKTNSKEKNENEQTYKTMNTELATAQIDKIIDESIKIISFIKNVESFQSLSELTKNLTTYLNKEENIIVIEKLKPAKNNIKTLLENLNSNEKKYNKSQQAINELLDDNKKIEGKIEILQKSLQGNEDKTKYFNIDLKNSENKILEATSKIPDYPNKKITTIVDSSEKIEQKTEALRQIIVDNKNELLQIQQKIINIDEAISIIEKNLELQAMLTVYEEVTKDLSESNFPTYVQNKIIGDILLLASKKLESFSSIFDGIGMKDHEEKKKDAGELVIYDRGEERSVATLSGGEKFVVSLAFILGISEYIVNLQNENQHMSIESLIIDEGFGSLDEENLDMVIQALEEVAEERMVAIITHVKDIEKRTPSALKIKRGTTEKIEVLN